MRTSDAGRRRFLINAALVTAAAPILAITGTGIAHAALPKLPVTNAQAKALSYTEDASKVKHPSYKPNSHCANCNFFNAANQTCQIFPGFTVQPTGWCSAWAAKKT